MCQGRLASIELADKTPVAFVRRPQDAKPILFSIPRACVADAVSGESLCKDCLERQKRTAAAVEKRGGKYVPNQQILLHGCFGEPLPAWSHMYGGEWYTRTRDEKELEIPEAVLSALPKSVAAVPVVEAMEKAPVKRAPKVKKAVEVEAAPPTVEPPAQTEKKAKPRAKKAVAETEPEPAPITEIVVSAPLVPVAPKEAVKPTPKPKPRAKKAAVATPPAAKQPIIGIIDTQKQLDDLEIVEIHVRKTEIDGRAVYLSSHKDKVYDLKFKYIGRYNRLKDCIEAQYPDSDQE